MSVKNWSQKRFGPVLVGGGGRLEVVDVSLELQGAQGAHVGSRHRERRPRMNVVDDDVVPFEQETHVLAGGIERP